MTERYVSPVPLPTPRQAELLTCLIEECAEVIKEASKCKRFGILEQQPGHDLNNSERLSFEIGDLLALIDAVTGGYGCEGMIDQEYVEAGIIAKPDKLDKYLQTEPDHGNNSTTDKT